MPREGYTSITIKEESYWKLANLKVKLRAKSWDELIDKICEVMEEWTSKD